MLEIRKHIVREKWIDIETSKIIRDKLRWCYRIECLNHLQKCRHLVQQYMDSTRGIGWGKDSRHPDQHVPSLHSITLHFCFIICFLFYSNSLFLFQVQRFRA
ncbi:putative NADH dehydrogenase [ubiquinone] 1 beta subcomplex subunit 10 [Helianthus anomalus]